MEKEILENYEKAKSVSDEVFELVRKLIENERKVFVIAESVENKIMELKAKPAFPTNISINEIAAHYTPDINDSLVIKENDLVKIDIGVQVDGYIWDRAFTMCLGERDHPLIKISEKALGEALKLIKPGTKVYEISEVVEETIKNEGFNPIHNLCGHGLEQFNQHASPTIPNGKNTSHEEIVEGQAIAMEVFTTNGTGLVKESYPVMIYKFGQDKPTRLLEAKKILEASKVKFDGLPFAKRWLTTIATPFKIDMALRQLSETGALIEYPVLKEETNGLVAQTEETVIVK